MKKQKNLHWKGQELVLYYHKKSLKHKGSNHWLTQFWAPQQRRRFTCWREPNEGSPPSACWHRSGTLLVVFAHRWLMLNLVSTRSPESFAATLLPRQAAPSTSWCEGLSFPTCRTSLSAKSFAKAQLLAYKNCTYISRTFA